MKWTIIKTSLIILFSFIFLWLILDKLIIPSTRVSNISNEDWITMTSTFFGGTLGGLIALIGISAQLKHTKEEDIKKSENLLKEKKKEL